MFLERRGTGLARRFSTTAVLLVMLLGTGGAAAPSQKPMSYPTRGDIAPFRSVMLGSRNATIYHIGSPPDLLPPGYSPDSPGSLMGYPILNSVSVRRVSWLDSLSEIVLNPRNYVHEERLCIQTPSLAVRVRGERDSVTVLTGSDCEFLLARTGSGAVISGWLDDPAARENLRILTEELPQPSGTDTPLVGPRNEDPERGEFVYYEDPPVKLEGPAPVYPEAARVAGVRGTVMVHLLIGRDGRVKSVKVIRSVAGLDEAATQAVSRWVFKPALSNNKPVAVWIEVSVPFPPTG
jgi:TonB family protein